MKAKRRIIKIDINYKKEYFEKLRGEGWQSFNPNFSENRIPPGFASEILKVVHDTGWFKFYKRAPSYVVFDNGGETLDRYTIINEDGDMLGLSETGGGYDEFCGNCVDDVMYSSFGASWRRQLNVPRVIHHKLPEIIQQFEDDGNLGERIEFSGLPEELQKHIKSRFETIN